MSEEEKEAALITNSPAIQNGEGAFQAIFQLAQMQTVDIEKMRAVIDVYNSQQDRELERQFYEAFTIMQTEIPAIAKTRNNTQTKSKYAALEDIDKIVKPILKKHGFSSSFTSRWIEGTDKYEGTYFLIYQNGWKAKTSLVLTASTCGINGNKMMTETHGVGSVISYLKRYCICMALNIATADDDGNAAGGVSYISQAQQSLIMEFYHEMPEDAQVRFMAQYGDFNKVPVSEFTRVVNGMKKEINQGRNNATDL